MKKQLKRQVMIGRKAIPLVGWYSILVKGVNRKNFSNAELYIAAEMHKLLSKTNFAQKKQVMAMWFVDTYSLLPYSFIKCNISSHYKLLIFCIVLFATLHYLKCSVLHYKVKCIALQINVKKINSIYVVSLSLMSGHSPNAVQIIISKFDR